jgi:hypothetical protein
MIAPEVPVLIGRQAELPVDAPRAAAKREAQERPRAQVPVVRVAPVIRRVRVAYVRAKVPGVRVTQVRAEVPAIRVACVRAVVPNVRVANVSAVIVGPLRVNAVIRGQRPVRVRPRRQHNRRVSVRIGVVIAAVRRGVHRRLAGILSRRGVDGARGAVGARQGIDRQRGVRHDGPRGGRDDCGLRGQHLRLGGGQLARTLVLGRQIDQADDRQTLVNDYHRLAVGVLGRRLLPARELAEVPGLRPGRHGKRRRQLVQRQLAVAIVRLDKRNGAVGDHLRVRRRGSVHRCGIGKRVGYLIAIN